MAPPTQAATAGEIEASARWNGVPRAQRAFDLVGLALLAPLLLLPTVLVALLVFLDSPGPVLYRARRIGLGGEPFAMLKFRTMRDGADGAGVTAANDLRVTPLGRFLRVSRLDELPQLWNVLRGEMRLVGPRPEDELFVAQYRRDYEEILTVPPGLTGPAQVRFAAAEAELLAESEDPEGHYRHTVLPSKVVMDLAYARENSLTRDLAILGRTLVLPVRLTAGRLRLFAIRHRSLAPAYGFSAAVTVILIFTFILVSGSAR